MPIRSERSAWTTTALALVATAWCGCRDYARFAVVGDLRLDDLSTTQHDAAAPPDASKRDMDGGSACGASGEPMTPVGVAFASASALIDISATSATVVRVIPGNFASTTTAGFVTLLQSPNNTTQLATSQKAGVYAATRL